MQKLVLVGAAGAALITMPVASTQIEAAPLRGTTFQGSIERLSAVEKIDFVYGGRRHCWYADGWKGPGWYWCGYRTRRGEGWGGARGWNGWAAPTVVIRPNAPAVVVRPPTVAVHPKPARPPTVVIRP
jgi:hypothetical protein